MTTGGTAAANTTAITADMAGATAGAIKTVQIPAGTYSLNGITIPTDVRLHCAGPKTTILSYAPAIGDGITLAANTGRVQIIGCKLYSPNSSTGAAIAGRTTGIREFLIDDYEIEGFKHGIDLHEVINSKILQGRLIGQGKAVAGSIGIKLGDFAAGRGGTINKVIGDYTAAYETGVAFDLGEGNIHIGTEEGVKYGLSNRGFNTSIGSYYAVDTYAIRNLAGGYAFTLINPAVFDNLGNRITDPEASGYIEHAATPESVNMFFQDQSYIGADFTIGRLFTVKGDTVLGDTSADTVTTKGDVLIETKIGVGAAATYSLDVQASKPGDVIARFKNTSVTGSGIVVALTDDAFPAIQVDNVAGTAHTFQVRGDGDVQAAGAGIVAPVGTGITVVVNGRLGIGVSQVTVDYTNCIAAAQNCDLTIATLPAKSYVQQIVAELAVPYVCAATCTTATLTGTLGRTAGTTEWLAAFDADAAAAVFGDADAELGTEMTAAARVANGAMIPGVLGSWTGTTNLVYRLNSGTGNLGTGAASNLNAGSVTFYIVLNRMP